MGVQKHAQQHEDWKDKDKGLTLKLHGPKSVKLKPLPVKFKSTIKDFFYKRKYILYSLEKGI